jgi:translation initiation factor IF-3
LPQNNRRNNRGRRDTGPKHRINERIRVPEVRVVEGLETGVYKTKDALRQAEELGLDLVEVVANQRPPICRVIDYKKFLYEQKRREKEQEKKNRENRVKVKELKFTPNTGDNDVKHKLKKAIEFLGDGDKVKATVQFKGRMIVHKDLGTKLLLQFAEDLEEHGTPESLPRMEGRRMTMTIKPKKGKKN